jgi:ABC-type glycerol-3-phosphate transport system permease component
VATAVTLIKVIFDSMAGYAFAKMKFPFRNLLFVVVIMTMMIPFSAILIPLYFMVFNFDLLNTYWALILPPLANPIGIFLMRGFIEGLPSASMGFRSLEFTCASSCLWYDRAWLSLQS